MSESPATPAPEQTPEQKAEAQWTQDLAFLAERPEFRRFLMTVLDSPDWCGTFGASYTPDGRPPDMHQVTYAEGRRSIGIQLNNALQEAAPRMVLRMFNEQGSNRARLLSTVPTPPES